MANYNKKKSISKRNEEGRGRSNPRASKPKLDKFDAKSATNNPQWYGNDPALLRDSSSLPFSWALGTPINLHNQALDVLPSGQNFAIPGICSLVTVPAIGRADDASDPVNTAAFNVYTFVRHLNSGHANYDAPDLMLYLLSMTQVYSYINFLQRAYGLVTTYAQKNRYLPDRLLETMYIDASDVRSHLADFRYGINVLINKAASLCVPATMSIFARHASLYQNVYIEGSSIKDQMYLYNPRGFWKYTLSDDSSGALEFIEFRTGGLHTVQTLLEYGNNMLARLIQSEDLNIMSGDIRKAYGDGALIKLAALPTEYPVIPIADLAVLQQIKNTIAVGHVSGLNVVQDSTHGWLKFQPVTFIPAGADDYTSRAYSFGLQTLLEDKILTVATAEPSPEEIMETTRCMPAFKNYIRDESGLSAQADIIPGSEIVTQAIYYTINANDPDLPLTASLMGYYNAIDVDNQDAVAAAFYQMSNVGHFKFHPPIHNLCFRQGSAAQTFNIANANLVFDVDNYTVINNTVLERMHEAALLSMLNVPSIIKV